MVEDILSIGTGGSGSPDRLLHNVFLFFVQGQNLLLHLIKLVVRHLVPFGQAFDATLVLPLTFYSVKRSNAR
jgi:hypothetical protein